MDVFHCCKQKREVVSGPHTIVFIATNCERQHRITWQWCISWLRYSVGKGLTANSVERLRTSRECQLCTAAYSQRLTICASLYKHY